MESKHHHLPILPIIPKKKRVRVFACATDSMNHKLREPMFGTQRGFVRF